MAHNKALSLFSEDSVLQTLLRGGSTYTTPYVLDVSDVQDETSYSFWVNSTEIEFTSLVGATKESILLGLKAVVDGTALDVTATLFEDEEEIAASDASKRLKIVQDSLVAPFVLSSVSANLGATQPVYIALYNQEPDESLLELTAKDGYHRVKGTWDAPTDVTALDDDGVTTIVVGTEIKLAADVQFGPAGEEWGSITHYGVYDQLEGGNLLAEGPISVPKNVLENDYYLFRDGDLIIRLK